MKITVELDEFWMDEDSNNLSEELHTYVKNQVIHNVWSKIKDQVDSEIVKKINELSRERLEYKVSELIDKIVDSEQVRSPSIGIGKDGVCSLYDKLKHSFLNDSSYSNPTSKLQDLAKRFGQELKDRYDTLFASQIIIKVSEQGLLKDGVIESLLKK